MQMLAALGSLPNYRNGAASYKLTSFGSRESACVFVECDREGAPYSVHATVHYIKQCPYINLPPSKMGSKYDVTYNSL
jgi:hypothetical protein